MSTSRKRGIAFLVLIAVLGVGGGVAYRLVTDLPKRFAAVAEGRLYRSGEVTPAQLGRLRERYRIGRVICLLHDEAPQTVAERESALGLGIEWHNIPLTGDGSSTPADRAAILDLLREPNAPPTLVHCAAGANRTGLAVGLYRIDHDGWSYDQVLAEMKEFGFEDLPKHANLRAALAEAARVAESTTTAPASAPAP